MDPAGGGKQSRGMSSEPAPSLQSPRGQGSGEEQELFPGMVESMCLRMVTRE